MFNHGEKIRCIFHDHSLLLDGGIYTVNYVAGEKVFLEEVQGFFLIGRFVKEKITSC